MKTYQVICDECGEIFKVNYWDKASSVSCNYYICPDCLDKIELEDPLVEVCGFPKLEGSKKQREWAITIRQKLQKKFGKGKIKSITVEDLKTQSSAAWWIDHRFAK